MKNGFFIPVLYGVFGVLFLWGNRNRFKKSVTEKTSFTSLLRKWDKIRQLREAVAKKVVI